MAYVWHDKAYPVTNEKRASAAACQSGYSSHTHYFYPMADRCDAEDVTDRVITFNDADAYGQTVLRLDVWTSPREGDIAVLKVIGLLYRATAGNERWTPPASAEVDAMMMEWAQMPGEVPKYFNSTIMCLTAFSVPTMEKKAVPIGAIEEIVEKESELRSFFKLTTP